MANPVRSHDDPRTHDPRVAADPLNPVPPLGPDARRPEPRFASNDPVPGSTTVVKTDRGSGTSVLIAAAMIVLAVIAFLVYGRSGGDMPADTTAVPGQPAVTEPAAPGAAAPEATAPAEPAAPAQPAPQAAEPAPAEPAPAQPAPAQ